MGTTDATTKSPSELRDEYGPAPWWSEDHLAELLHYEGLTARQIADVWGAHPQTVDDYVSKYGLREGGR